MVAIQFFAVASATLAALVAAQGEPVTTCTGTLKDPPPPRKVCGEKGYLKKPLLIRREKVTGPNVQAKAEKCFEMCYADTACKSFALNTQNSYCRLLRAETKAMGTLNNPDGKNPTIHYDNACYTPTCTSCIPLLPKDFPVTPLTNPDVVFGNHSAASADDALFRLDLPFSVTFFGFSSSIVQMSVNGWASLKRNAGWTYFIDDLPSENNEGSSDSVSFFPFWADFYVSNKSSQALFFQVKQATGTVDLTNTALASTRRRKLARGLIPGDDANARTVTLEWLVSSTEAPSSGGDPSILWQFQTTLFADRPNLVVYNYIQVPQVGIDHTVGAQSGGNRNLGPYSQYQNPVQAGTLLIYDYENSPDAGFIPVTPGVCTPTEEQDPTET